MVPSGELRAQNKGSGRVQPREQPLRLPGPCRRTAQHTHSTPPDGSLGACFVSACPGHLLGRWGDPGPCTPSHPTTGSTSHTRDPDLTQDAHRGRGRVSTTPGQGRGWPAREDHPGMTALGPPPRPTSPEMRFLRREPSLGASAGSPALHHAPDTDLLREVWI